MRITFNFNDSDAETRYLLACARIRRLSVASLLRRLIMVVGREQLVLAILDDDSIIAKRAPGEHAQQREHF